MNIDKFRIVNLLLGLLAISIVLSFSARQLKSSPSKGDIDIFLNASRLAVEGHDIYASPNRGGIDYYVYPPLLAVALAPIAYLPIEIAVFVWGLLSALLLYLLLHFLYEGISGEKFSGLSHQSRLLLVGLPIVFTARPLLAHFQYGQANILVIFIAVCGFVMLARAYSSGGLLVGLSMVIKVLTLPLAVVLPLRYSAKSTAFAIAGMILGFLAPAIVLGWERNISLLRFWVGSIVLDDSARLRHWNPDINFSLQAQLARYFTDVSAFNGAPFTLTIAPLDPFTIKLIGFAAMAAVITSIVIFCIKSRDKSTLIAQWGAVALTFALTPIFSPVALKHHFVALLPAYFYLIYLWYFKGLKDRFIIGSMIVSSALISLTSEGLIGDHPSKVANALGCMPLGALFLSAAVFRLPFLKTLFNETEPEPRSKYVQKYKNAF